MIVYQKERRTSEFDAHLFLRCKTCNGKNLVFYEFNAIVGAITAQLGEFKEENTSCSHRKLIHFNNFKKI